MNPNSGLETRQGLYFLDIYLGQREELAIVVVIGNYCRYWYRRQFKNFVYTILCLSPFTIQKLYKWTL